MDWFAAYYYAVLLQEERVRRAQEPGWGLSWQPVRRWLSTVRGRVAAWAYAHGQTAAWRGRKSQHEGLARTHD
jgi:hypothetical protein